MQINIKYEWLMNTSNTLSVLANNVSESLELPKIEQYEKEIYEKSIEKSLFYIFNTISKAQGLDTGIIKQVIYDSEEKKETIKKAFLGQLQEELQNFAIYPSKEELTTVIDTIQKEILKYSASCNNTVLDYNLEPVKEKSRTPEQEQVFKHNENVNVFSTVIQLQVEFKTGNLIVTDLLKINELNEITEAVLAGSGSLNYPGGCHERTKRLAQKLNIVSVSIGDVGPTLFKKDDTLIFGNARKQHSFNNLGYIDVAFLGTTIYEKENVLELLSLKVGNEKAKELLDKELSGNNVLELQVSPGFYQVTLGEFFEDFSSDVRNSGAKIPSCTNIKPWFTLEKIELTPKKTNKKKM